MSLCFVQQALAVYRSAALPLGLLSCCIRITLHMTWYDTPLYTYARHGMYEQHRLETDIQTLEQHLESMRAAYQLNQEKLDYNYRVLLERDAENVATVTQQKRKVSKQRDLLSSLMVPPLLKT